MSGDPVAIPVTVRWFGGELELESASGDASSVRTPVGADFIDRFHDVEHRGDRLDPNQPTQVAPATEELEQDCLQIGYELGQFFEPLLQARVGAPSSLTRFELRARGADHWSVPVELARIVPSGVDGSDVERLVVVPDVSVARVWASSLDPPRDLLVERELRLVGSFVEAPGLNVEADRVRFESAVQAAAQQGRGLGVGSVITDGTFDGPAGLVAALSRDSTTPTVVVLSGHGSPGQVTFADGDVDAARLRDALAGTDARAVLLAVCSGAQPPAGPGGGLDTARTLVAAGVPVVVAMAARIDGRLATEFVDGFLGELLAGETVDAAVREGRRKMDERLHEGGRRWSWALPRLVVAARPGAGYAAGPRRLDDREVRLVPQPTPPAHRGVVRVRNLDEQPPAVVGRDAEVASLSATVASAHTGRVVHAISGQRGVGKSSVARMVAADSRAEVVWWFRADDWDAVLDGFDLLHRRLGLPEPARDDRATRLAAVCDHLASLGPSAAGGPRWLLVFDNVAAGSAAEVVERWAPRGGPGAVVLTVNGDAEWDHGRTDLQPLRRDDAARLLASLARVAVSESVDQLVDLLGGVPLALVHLGGLMRERWWSPEFALEQLRDRPATVLGGVGEDDRTVAGVVARALAELLPEDRVLFAALCQLDADAIPASLVLSSASAGLLGRAPAELHDAFAVFRSLGLVEADRSRGLVRVHRLTAIVARHLVASGDVPLPARIGSGTDGERGAGG